MKRRQFLKAAVPVLFLLADKRYAFGNYQWLAENFKKPILRFAVASDGHYGQPDTAYDSYYQQLISNINDQHNKSLLDCCIINGDIIHNEPLFLPQAKELLTQLEMPYWVTQGNHDMVTEDVWMDTWQMPFNHHFSIKEQAFLLATTSNERGEYLCPDLLWMQERLDEYKSARNIFIFIHITPVKWTSNGIDCSDFTGLLKNYKNVRAVFNGHDHDQDGVKINNGIPYLFSAHFGGNWGTNYRGFRMVEVMHDNTIATYILNPNDRINEYTFGKKNALLTKKVKAHN